MKLAVIVEPGPRKRAIGCKAGARKALMVKPPLTPLGHGLYKQAYTDGKVVYKVAVDKQASRDCNWNLEHEFRQATHFRKEGSRWAAPTSLYRIGDEVVVAQPLYGHVSDLPDELRDKAWREANRLDGDYVVGDFHEGNWRVTPRGQVRVIDLSGG